MKNKITTGSTGFVIGTVLLLAVSIFVQWVMGYFFVDKKDACLSEKCNVVFIMTLIQTIVSIFVYDFFREDFFSIETYKKDPDAKLNLPKIVIWLIHRKPQTFLFQIIKRILLIWLGGTTVGFILDRKDDPFAFSGILGSKSKILMILYPIIMIPWRFIYIWIISHIYMWF